MFLAAFVAAELRAEHPLFDLSLFRITFRGGLAAAFAMNGSLYALLLYLVLYLQDDLGYSALGTAGASQSSEYTNGLKYARCMRAHAEPDFPDPANPGGFSSTAIESLGPSSHQFGSANSRCARLLPNDGQLTPAELQQVIGMGLKFARCMRAHGQANFPDPGVSGGQITINLNSIDPNSPQFQTAEQTCGRAQDR